MIRVKTIRIHTGGELMAKDEVNEFKKRLAAFIQDELKSKRKPTIYLTHQNIENK